MRVISQKTIENWKNHLIEDEKSLATTEKYIRDISAFSNWLGGKTADKKIVLEYKECLIKSYAPASVNSILSSLNSFFAFMEWYELKVKTLKIQKQIFASAEKELTRAEYMRLLNAARQKGNTKLYLLMQTICAMGIRVSELKFVTVESLAVKKANINMKGKMRTIIIPNDLCKMLASYAKRQKISKGSIFVSQSGRPMDRSNIWKLMKCLCEAAKVAKEKVFPHNLRHLFARTFYSIQKDVVRLADILGHSNINTTRIYTMETGEEHRRLIQKLGLLQC